MYRVARRSLAVFASAVVCVADISALRATMATGGVVPGGDALSANVGSSGSPILAADVVGSVGVGVPGGAAAAAAAAVRTADGEEASSTAAATSLAAAAKNVVDR